MRARIAVGVLCAVAVAVLSRPSLATLPSITAPPVARAAAANADRPIAPATAGNAGRPAALFRTDLHYRIWTVEDGLPNGSVRAIAQTPDGYLWVATFDGLVRFDGVRMHVFSRSEYPEMASNRCLGLLVDRAGALWVSTEEGTVLEMTGRGLRSFGASTGIPDGPIALAGEDERGRVWIRTAKGPRRLDGERWSPPGADERPPLDPQSRPPVDGPFAASGPSRARGAPRQSNRLWIQSAGDRVWWLEDGLLSLHENGAWHMFPTPVPDVVLPRPVILFEDTEGTVWIGSDRGLVQASPSAVGALVPEGTLSDANVYSLTQDAEGSVWGTTENQGVFLYERGSFVPLRGRPWWPPGVFNSIRSVADGSLLWAGNDLLFRVKPGRGYERIEVRISALDVLSDRRGKIWMAGNEVLRQSASGWDRITTEQGLASNMTRVLLESRSGGMWIGTYGGLSYIDEAGAIRSWKAADGLSSERIRSLREDEAGTLWIGTYDGGLNRLDRLAKGRIIAIRKRDGLYDDGVFAILDDGLGRYWMSSNRGVFSVAKSELEAFAAGRVRRVSCRAWRAADGMPSSECNGGRQPSGFRAADGTLWFPTQRGIAVFDPRAVRTNTRPPHVVVEEITTDRRTIPRGEAIDLAPGERHLEVRFTAPTFVRPDLARFRHRLVGFDPDWVEDGGRRFAQYAYVPPGSYELRLLAANGDGVWSTEGVSLAVRVRPYWYETAWFRWGVLLLGIAGVAVIYRARVSRLERRRAEQDAFARRLIESQEAERKRIAGELHDGIGQTLMVIRNRALLGLRDAGEASAQGDGPAPAASEASPGAGGADRSASLGASGAETSGAATAGASTAGASTAGTSRLVRQMSEISEAASEGIEEVRKVAYGLRPYQLDRLGLTRALEAVVEQASASSGIPIVAAIDGVDGAFARDDEINVYRIVQEAVSNIIHHARASRGRVTVAARDHEVEMAIEDDGAGFDPGALAASGGGGLGLSGIMERARILGGSSAVRSSPGKGTVVTVTLPMRRAPRQAPAGGDASS